MPAGGGVIGILPPSEGLSNVRRLRRSRWMACVPHRMAPAASAGPAIRQTAWAWHTESSRHMGIMEGNVDVVVVSASPNRDGLTAACAGAAVRGAIGAGASAGEIRLNDLDVGRCNVCGNGWGTCRTDHECQVQDGFQALHERVCRADALVVVTPVYYGELSESAKAFTDRLRRCEATRGDGSSLRGKPVILVAAAGGGGGGGGTVTCLLALENWVHHIGARVFDLIPVKRWTRVHKLVAIEAATSAMVTGA